VSPLIENLLRKENFGVFGKRMNTLKIFILIGILISIGGGIFLIQKRETPETKIPEKKEIRIETKEE